jgi:hypothetical protein
VEIYSFLRLYARWANALWYRALNIHGISHLVSYAVSNGYRLSMNRVMVINERVVSAEIKILNVKEGSIIGKVLGLAHEYLQ